MVTAPVRLRPPCCISNLGACRSSTLHNSSDRASYTMSTIPSVADRSVELDSSALPKRLESRRMILQARSLVNVLNVVRRRLSQLQGERQYTKEDLQHHKHVLEDIDRRWHDEEGTFAGKLTAADPKTASLCSRLFHECWDMLEAMQHTTVEMPPELRDIYKCLVGLQAQLAKMQADANHTLAEVLPLQQALDEIDTERLSKSGSFASGAEASLPGERACNQVLDHCYELLSDCVRKAEDVSPEMKDVYDQLRGIKNALRKLLGKQHHTAEDLRHYQVQLEKIDGERKDGIFCGDLEKGIIPHGQASAAKLLDECYDLIEELAGSAEDMSPEMKEILEQLEQYRHELEGMLRQQRTMVELRAVQEKLDAIDDERQAYAGVFAHRADVAGKPPAGQDVCSAVLNHCYRMLHDLYADIVAVEQ